MLCNHCQELISDYVDGALELGEQVQIERHLADCEPCRAVRDDFLQIIHFSRQLPLHTPSSEVWTRIRSELEIERPANLLSRARLWTTKIRGLHFNLSIPQMAAGAMVLAILVTVAVITSRNDLSSMSKTTTAGLPSASTGIEANLLSNPDVEEMEHRIDQLKQEVEQQKVVWTPEIRGTFERNLIYVDQSLIECRQELSNNPTDPVRQEMMLNAYREKVRLLEGFTRF